MSLQQSDRITDLSVADELAFEYLPLDVQELCKKIFGYYYSLEELSYHQGYNDGKKETSDDLEEAGYKRGYEDAKEEFGKEIDSLKRRLESLQPNE